MITGGKNTQVENLRKAAESLGQWTQDPAKVKTFIGEYTAIDKPGNWELCSQVNAAGGDLDAAYSGAGFDGRYVYLVPSASNSFIRFDTHLEDFSASASWSQISLSTAQGAALLDSAYQGKATFDGKYMYFAARNSDTFVRYNIALSFTVTGSWDKCRMSTAQGSVPADDGYIGSCTDGRYIYFAPSDSDSLIRYDTTLSFTASGSWGRMNISTAKGVASGSDEYAECVFDGKYIYYCPKDATVFLRFNTLGTSFTTTADWETIATTDVDGATQVDAYRDLFFDGRYVYYAPGDSDTFVRFDTTKDFTVAASWETVSVSSAQGAASVANGFGGAVFDGRYVYFIPTDNLSMVRFDTMGTSFTTLTDWSTYNTSTAGGGGDTSSFSGGVYDGKYMYYAPVNTATVLRVLATPQA